MLPGRGSAVGGGILALPYYSHRGLCVYGGTAAGAQCLRLSERFLLSILLPYHCCLAHILCVSNRRAGARQTTVHPIS